MGERVGGDGAVEERRMSPPPAPASSPSRSSLGRLAQYLFESTSVEKVKGGKMGEKRKGEKIGKSESKEVRKD